MACSPRPLVMKATQPLAVNGPTTALYSAQAERGEEAFLCGGFPSAFEFPVATLLSFSAHLFVGALRRTRFAVGCELLAADNADPDLGMPMFCRELLPGPLAPLTVAFGGAGYSAVLLPEWPHNGFPAYHARTYRTMLLKTVFLPIITGSLTYPVHVIPVGFFAELLAECLELALLALAEAGRQSLVPPWLALEVVGVIPQLAPVGELLFQVVRYKRKFCR